MIKIIIVVFAVFTHLACMAATSKIGDLIVINSFTISNGTAVAMLTTNGLNTLYGRLVVNDSNDCFRAGTNVNPLKGTGQRNTFIGAHIAHRFLVNSNADDPVGIAGCDNIGIGSYVMENLTNNGAGVARRNVVIGGKAGQSMSNGWQNIFIGFRAGTDCDDGADNVAIGDGAIYLAKGAGFFGNTGVGVESLLCLTSNIPYNTGYGFHSGYGRFGGGVGSTTFVSPGTYNTYIGAFAGGDLRTNNVGHSNTVGLGFSAGYSGGTHCTYVGYRAGQNNTNDDDTVIIDGRNRFTYDLEKTDSLIYGRLSNNIPDQWLRINAGQVIIPTAGARLSVATTNFPSTTLTVNGSAFFRDLSSGTKGLRIEQATEASGYQLQNTDGGRNFYRAFNHVFSSESSNEMARLTSTGLGILMSPGGALDVNGNTRMFGALTVSGNAYVKGTNGVANASVGGTINMNTTKVVSAGAAETNLITFAVPAHTLTNLNDRLRFRFAGNFAATANPKDLKVIFGSETIFDTSAQIVNSGAWTIEGEIIRVGNTSQEVSAEFHGAGVTLFTTASAGLLAQTNGIATTLKMTSTAAGNGDVTNRTLVVMYYPAP